MLKALKTLLKEDIINQKHMEDMGDMGTSQLITENQVSVLLWIKVLNDFKGEGYENASFNEKFQAFEAVEDTGLTRKEYEEIVDFWVASGVFKEKKRVYEISLTKKGKALFEIIDNMENDSDKEVRDALNELKDKNSLESIIEYVKQNPETVIGVIGLALQLAQLTVAVVK